MDVEEAMDIYLAIAKHHGCQTHWSVGPRKPSDQSDAILAGYLYM